ncbi:hypothetical protein AALA17_04030 [Lactobacillaceae bacterium 24-114]
MQLGTIYSYLVPYLTAIVAWWLANISSKRKAKKNWDNTLRELELTKDNNYKVQGRAYKLQFLLKEFERRSIPYTKAASDCNVIMTTINKCEEGSASSQEIVSSCNMLINDIHHIGDHLATTRILVRNVEQHKEQEFLNYIKLLDHFLGHEVEIMVHDMGLMVSQNQMGKMFEIYSKEKLQDFMKTMDQMQDFMMEMIQLTMDKME